MTKYRENFHTLSIDHSKCTGLMHCMRVCPTHAIRIRDKKAKIISDRCIDCGECIKVCSQRAIVPHTTSFTDLSRFKYTVAIPSPALYAQFQRDILPKKIQEGLKKLGFSEVIDVAETCEAVSKAIGEFLKVYKGPRPLISSFCPTVIRLIQIKYPELIDNLLPIEAPREIVAREFKKAKSKELGIPKEDIGAIYITPCPSKMLDIKSQNGDEKSSLDGIISIADIYSPLLEVMSNIKVKGEEKHLKTLSSYGFSWSMLGGVARPLKPENWLGVSGIHDVIRILSDIEDRKISDVDLIECHACVGGCVGGSLAVDNMYVARAKAIKLARRADKTNRFTSRKIQKLYKEGFFVKKKKIFPKPSKPLDSDLGKAIEKIKQKERILAKLPGIDCGACGSPSCASFAEDIALGHAKVADCFEHRERDLKKKENLKLVKE